MRAINKDLLDLGRAKYAQVSGLDDMERDDDGFIILKPTAEFTDRKMSSLTSNISTLEDKLKKYREEQTKTKKYKETDDYKEDKKKFSKKKAKKQKESLLQMVFNNADHADDDEEEDFEDDDDGTYRDSRKGKNKDKDKGSKKVDTTLETTYGMRFSPIMEMFYDTAMDFDRIATDIENDLKDSRNSARTMYRSSQIGNMITAKNSKLSAIKELENIAKTLSDFEYKREHDKKNEEGGNQNKAIASMASKYLAGSLDDYIGSSGGKKKGKKKEKSKDIWGSNKKSSDDDDDDDESDIGSIKHSSAVSKSDAEQKELASEFASALLKRKDEIKLSPWERNIAVENKYNVLVEVDPMNLDDWRYVAVSNKTGKEIEDFKEKYKDLLPKKKKSRMIFNLDKGRCTEKNSSRVYKLIYKN